MERTSGKWKVEGYGEHPEIRDEDGRRIAVVAGAYPVSVKREDANADYIVRAVNCHESLVDWVKNFADYCEENALMHSEMVQMRKLIDEAEGGGNG